MVRSTTSNWQPAALAPVGDYIRYNQFSEIDMFLKRREGEARVWSTTSEVWTPLQIDDCRMCGENGLGLNYPGTKIGKTKAARSAEFRNRGQVVFEKGRAVMEYGLYRHFQNADTDGEPELDDAVSTLVVRGTPGKKVKYWLRNVHVVSLVEVLKHFGDDVSFDKLYTAWGEGQVVLRPRPNRGKPGSGKCLKNFQALRVRAKVQ